MMSKNRIYFWNIKAHGLNSVPAGQFLSKWHHLFLMRRSQEWPQALRSWLKKKHWSPGLKYSYRRSRHECVWLLLSVLWSTFADGLSAQPIITTESSRWMWHLPPFSALIGSLPRRRKALKKQKRSVFLIFNCYWGSLKCICGELHCTVTTATKLIWALDYCSSLKEASLQIPGLWAHSSDLHTQFMNIWDFSDRFQ